MPLLLPPVVPVIVDDVEPTVGSSVVLLAVVGVDDVELLELLDALPAVPLVEPAAPITGGAAAVARTGRAVGMALTMMSPNCSGVLSRPKVSIGIVKSWPFGAGIWPTMPAGASAF
jgi:hypothetical protein